MIPGLKQNFHWNDIKGRYALLFGGLESFDFDPITDWTICRIDEFSGQDEVVLSGHYFQWDECKPHYGWNYGGQIDRGGQSVQEYTAQYGKIARVFDSYDQAKAAAYRLRQSAGIAVGMRREIEKDFAELFEREITG